MTSAVLALRYIPLRHRPRRNHRRTESSSQTGIIVPNRNHRPKPESSSQTGIIVPNRNHRPDPESSSQTGIIVPNRNQGDGGHRISLAPCNRTIRRSRKARAAHLRSRSGSFDNRQAIRGPQYNQGRQASHACQFGLRVMRRPARNRRPFSVETPGAPHAAAARPGPAFCGPVPRVSCSLFLGFAGRGKRDQAVFRPFAAWAVAADGVTRNGNAAQACAPWATPKTRYFQARQMALGQVHSRGRFASASYQLLLWRCQWAWEAKAEFPTWSGLADDVSMAGLDVSPANRFVENEYDPLRRNAASFPRYTFKRPQNLVSPGRISTWAN